MDFYVGKDIVANNPTSDLYAWCRQNLVLDNPEYYKKVRLGKWVGRTPIEFELYEKIGGCLVLPFGCVQKLMHDFPKDRNRYFTRLKQREETIDYRSEINLYDYQKEAFEKALKKKNGVIVMPCGSGKTQTALSIVAKLGLRCLWLTHTQDLLNQSYERAKNVLGVDPKTYGKITGGKVEIGSGITFATVQTMCNIDLAKYRDEWGIVIVDECHHAIGSPTRVMQFYKVLSNIACRYKLGLTATPKRSDGLEMAMFALLGPIVHEVSKEAVKGNTCDVVVETAESGYIPNIDAVLAGDGTINYSTLVNDMIFNEDRFDFVLNLIHDKQRSGAMLVLANRIEYLQRLNESFCGRSLCLSGGSQSKSAKLARKAALQALNNGEIDCIFATYQLAKEGLDVPNLRTVIFATPESNETTIVQAAGRVARKFPGKDHGTVVDILDDFGMYRGWQKKRNAYYKKLSFLLT